MDGKSPRPLDRGGGPDRGWSFVENEGAVIGELFRGRLWSSMLLVSETPGPCDYETSI